MGTSRAVLRFIEAGNSAECAGCGETVLFKARTKAKQVICNVYVAGRWDRVEHFHEECYGAAGQPHGRPDESQPFRQRQRPSAAA